VVVLGTRPATVRFTTLSGKPVAGQPVRSVEPGSPFVLGPSPGVPFASAPFEVRADQPVAVELDALPVAAPGVAVVPAFATS
jgi:hypothetical protein